MRIVYVLTSLGMGGAERQTVALARRMLERGHSVQWMVLRRLREEWPVQPAALHLDLRKTPWSAAAGLLRARRLLRELQPDVVHSHGFHANLFVRALRLAGGPAPISTVHNVYEGGGVRMLAYRLTDSLSWRTAAVSAAVAQRFIELGAISARKCAIMPNAIDVAEFVPDAARRTALREAMGAGEDFVWLAAGRIAAAKDYPNLLRAFARVRSAVRQTQLWIAGEDRAGNEPALQAYATELGISAYVRWLGLRRDLPALIDGADGFVLSSAWEGMPLAIAEAMAMEKPVVATDAGGVRELVGEAGVIVAIRDAEALAAAMLGTMRLSPAVRGARGRAARERIAAGFSMETRAGQWEELYRMAIAERL